MWGWWKEEKLLMSWLIFNSVPHTHFYIIDAKKNKIYIGEWEREKEREGFFCVNVNNWDERLKMLNIVPPSQNFRSMCSMWGSLILNRIQMNTHMPHITSLISRKIIIIAKINYLMTFFSLINCRLEENERMDRREQQKQQQKQQFQRMSQNDNDSPQTPLFGVPKKVSHDFLKT